MARKMVLKFKHEDFLNDDIPNLMINIWCCSDEQGLGAPFAPDIKNFV